MRVIAWFLFLSLFFVGESSAGVWHFKGIIQRSELTAEGETKLSKVAENKDIPLSKNREEVKMSDDVSCVIKDEKTFHFAYPGMKDIITTARRAVCIANGVTIYWGGTTKSTGLELQQFSFNGNDYFVALGYDSDGE